MVANIFSIGVDVVDLMGLLELVAIVDDVVLLVVVRTLQIVQILNLLQILQKIFSGRWFKNKRFLSLLQVLSKVFKLEPLIIINSMSDFKNTHITVVVQLEILLNGILNHLQRRLTLRIVGTRRLLNNGMWFNNNFNIWKWFVLFLQLYFRLPRIIKFDEDLSDQIQIGLLLRFAMRKVNKITDSKIFHHVTAVDLKRYIAHCDIHLF